MYRVLIADDEQSVRERLVAFVKRLPEDFLVVGAFDNGYDALESAPSLEPDLIITDIKMPFVTGLELIRQSKLELPLLQSIIVSGFDNFDYAKQAIDLGVVGYISKPATFDEIKEALDKAKAELDKKLTIDPNLDDIQSKSESVLKIVQSSDLNRLVTMKVLSPNFRKKLAADGIVLDKLYLGFAIFDPDVQDDDLSYEKSELLFYYLDQFISEEFDEKDYFIFENSGMKSVFFQTNVKINKEEFQSSFVRIVAKIEKTCNVSVSVGVSDLGCIGRAETISYRRLYRHAKWTLEYRTVIGSGIVLFYDDLASKGKTIGKVDENEFKNISYAILYGKGDEARELIKKMVMTVSTLEYKDSYFLIVNNLVDAILKSSVAIDELYTSYMPHVAIMNEVFASKSPSSVIEAINRLVDKVISINEEKKTSGVDAAYIHICDFIEANFAKSSISLDDVADELGYSVSYVSAILKKHGTSFTKYLTKCRMEKAQALLADKSKKLLSIAIEIGYEDPYYFSHCFKKFFGVSPVEYRKS